MSELERRTDVLDKRMNGIEEKVDLIIRLLSGGEM